ncbi:hypothetical protein LZ32DRAFT_629398 [Colletotrichum eremochloae]|nr:hypothetical protein LZ32DRAFT_629398 [Colletotrichum eremochloae]
MSSPPVDPDAALFGTAQNIDGQALTVIGWSNVSTSFVFLLLRLLLRWRRNRCLLLDDYLIILGWLCLLALAIIQMEQVGPMYYLIQLQAGRFVPTSLQEVLQKSEQWLQWSYAMNYVYWTGLWAVKASILTIFFHLVSPVPILRKAWYCVAGFTLLTYIGGWVAGSMVCDRFTDFFVLGKCNSPSEVERARFSGYYAAAVDIATDLLIMGLPIAVLPGLQLDIRKKLGLAVAFSLALLTILTAVIRMTQVMKPDGLDMVGLSVWSITELGVSIVVGSLPPLRILFTSGFRRYIKGKKADHKCPAKGRDDNGNGYCPDTIQPTLLTTKMLEKHDREHDDEIRRAREKREEAARRSQEEAREWAERIRQDMERAREQTRVENEQRERERSIEHGRQRNR